MSEKKDGSEFLQIPKRHVSFISGGLIFVAAMLFTGGYFLGTYQAVESFVLKAEQDSFADQVYASLSALYDQDSPAKVEGDGMVDDSAADDAEVGIVAAPIAAPVAVEQEKEVKEINGVVEMPALSMQSIMPAESKEPALVPANEHEQKLEINDDEIDDEDEKVPGAVDAFELAKLKEKAGKHWYAQLIGYGLEKSAREFAQKLTKKGFGVKVAARTSRSAAGRQRTWYQVVTNSYENRDLLQKQVDKIVSLEKLKGVQISVC